MHAPYAEIAAPLYTIPTYLWESLPETARVQCLNINDGNAVHVFSAPEDFDTLTVWTEYDGDDRAPVSDFRYRYTPTPEEVCRALRGPQGYVGPVGAQGAPGTPGADLAEITSRLAETERGVTAAMRAVTTLVTDLVNTGVLDANNDQKEQ